MFSIGKKLGQTNTFIYLPAFLVVWAMAFVCAHYIDVKLKCELLQTDLKWLCKYSTFLRKSFRKVLLDGSMAIGALTSVSIMACLINQRKKFTENQNLNETKLKTALTSLCCASCSYGQMGATLTV